MGTIPGDQRYCEGTEQLPYCSSVTFSHAVPFISSSPPEQTLATLEHEGLPVTHGVGARLLCYRAGGAPDATLALLLPHGESGINADVPGAAKIL